MVDSEIITSFGREGNNLSTSIWSYAELWGNIGSIFWMINDHRWFTSGWYEVTPFISLISLRKPWDTPETNIPGIVGFFCAIVEHVQFYCNSFPLQPGSSALRGSHEVTCERRSWSPTSSGHVPRLGRDGPKLIGKGEIWTLFELSSFLGGAAVPQLVNPVEDLVMRWKNMADNCWYLPLLLCYTSTIDNLIKIVLPFYDSFGLGRLIFTVFRHSALSALSGTAFHGFWDEVL